MLDNYLKENQEKKIIVGGDFNTVFLILNYVDNT